MRLPLLTDRPDSFTRAPYPPCPVGGVASVPAIVVLGMWIVIQLVSQLGSIAQTSEGGGIPYMAHIGGFVAGMALVKLFATRQLATA
jgi:membrane associated rhomboid family serine protease